MCGFNIIIYKKELFQIHFIVNVLLTGKYPSTEYMKYAKKDYLLYLLYLMALL